MKKASNATESKECEETSERESKERSDSRSILCGFEGAEKRRTESAKVKTERTEKESSVKEV